MIGVVHGFSRSNAGDSLLVDLTIERLVRLGVPADQITLFAMEPTTFRDLPRVVEVPGEPSGRPTLTALRAGTALARSMSPFAHGAGGHRALTAVQRCDGIVAVGGAYLRAGNLVNAVGVSLNHLPTLRAVSRGSAPAIYLPQSIGPLSGAVGRMIRSSLASVDVVCVRDDISAAELDLPNVRRLPDLAVLALGEGLEAGSRTMDAAPVIVGRAVDGPRADAAAAALADLGQRLGARWAVQADVGGDRSDARFYDRLGVGQAPSLLDVLGSEPPGVVVSVRLHGALQALLAGWPAIHLSYQRKGWAAYDDLGLGEFVHSAFAPPVDLITEQVLRIQADPDRFWEPVRAGREKLLTRSQELDHLIRDTLALP